MSSRLVCAFLVMFFSLISCKTVDNVIPPDAEVKLVSRIKEFRSYLSIMDCKKAWEMRSESFKKRFSKESYEEYLACKRERFSDYEIVYLDRRDKRAKVKIIQYKKEHEDEEKVELENYSFWIYERGNWYLAETGVTGIKADWW